MAFKRTLVSTLATLAVATGCTTVPPAPDAGTFFDDFNYADSAAMVKGGWIIRDKSGLPGMITARWSPENVVLKDDPTQPGNRIVSMLASTNGTPEGTRQAQFCHARKYLEGTYAARINFSDMPLAGMDGDTLVQSFYVVSPLRYAYDPTFSELDWEYLPNGGWGDPKTRIYATSWHTVRLDPWDSFNLHEEAFRSLDGWHTLVMQVDDGKIKYFIDGVPFAKHGGRSYPVVPMSMNFNLWFIANGFAKEAVGPRLYHEDVDWVYHAKNRILSPEAVDAEVKKYKAANGPQVDTMPVQNPVLASTCDF